MIKKITNWTVGSIFRTIGRFLAYLIIGIIIALFFVKKDYVKADTIQPLGFEFKDTNGNVLPQLNGLPPYVRGYNHTITNNGSGTDEYYLRADKSYYPYANFDYALINLYVLENGATTYYRTSSTNTGTLYNNQFGFYVEMITNGTWSQCNMENYAKNGDIAMYTIKCPRAKNATGIQKFNIQWVYDNFGIIENLDMYLKIGISYSINFISGDSASIIENQNQNHNETMNYFNSTISGEVNGTGENGTITDADAESSSCGIICKLKHLINMLSIDNIKYIVVPTEEQMNDLFEQMQTKITSKLGILGLPVTVYTRLMQIAMQYEEGQQNWCLTWNAVQVPNFEDFNIIQAGSFCFSDILQNEKINTFRNTCQMIIGGLILLSFIQYLFNCLHRILDVPIQDNYEYFTTEDVYGIDTDTGEVQSHTIKSRTTTRRPV